MPRGWVGRATLSLQVKQAGSVPGAEQDEGLKGPPFPAVGLLDFSKNSAGIEDETLDFALVEDGESVVIHSMTLVLQVD